jgi:hypothetical protein
MSVILLLMLLLSSQGQTPVGAWSDHLSYNSAINIAIGSDEIYASTGSSIIVYNKIYDELKKMSRISGLAETGIETIAWSDENNTLIIAYSSANIDLLSNNVFYNIPDIKRKYIPGNKEINRIRTGGKYAYLACSFGIVVLDITRKEIYDTWNPGTGSEDAEVWDIGFGNGKIYAATGAGVFSGDLSNRGLSYYGNWSRIDELPAPGGNYTSLIFSGNKLFVNQSVKNSTTDRVYAIDGGVTLITDASMAINSSFDPAPDGFTITSSGSVKYFESNGALIKTIIPSGLGTPAMSQAIIETGNIWIADKKTGLIRGEGMSAFSALTLPGPISNNAYSITSHNGKTIVCGGGTNSAWNNLETPFQISLFENNDWISLPPGTFTDPMRTLIDPANNNHFFVSMWGKGLLEYENNILINQYTEANSSLNNIIPGKPYVRICGLAMDKKGILWMTQPEVPGSIKALKPDGNWIANPVRIEVPTIGDIIVAKNGYKWVILPRGNGLFILDDNDTPELFTDDRSKRMLVEDTENEIISMVYSIAEDLDGNIWVGTDQGPLIYYNPEKVFEDDLNAYRIKISRNDGSGLADYMLGSESITSITIDGSNRKWLGTSGSGAYYLSADGATLLKNFNEENSPVLSNSIISMAVDNKTGDVWFGTSKGVQSFRGNATTGEGKFTNVYSFPNPVRENFLGNVTITGLTRDSEIKITDISGNLVYETVSDGGMATWDLKTFNGNRVATGVYLVFCSSSDGSQSCVTKMLVIK